MQVKGAATPAAAAAPLLALLPLLAVVGGLGAFSGCLECKPLLDVRHCLPDSPRCAPHEGDPLVPWNATLAQQWPDIARFVATLPPGEHGHREWDEGGIAAFWAAFGVDPARHDKEVYFQVEGGAHPGLFQVRLVEC